MGKSQETIVEDKIVDLIAENEQALNATENHFDKNYISGRIEGLKLAQQIGVNIVGDSGTLKQQNDEAIAKIDELLKAKSDLYTQLEDVNKVNDELRTTINNLQTENADALKTIERLTKELEKKETPKE